MEPNLIHHGSGKDFWGFPLPVSPGREAYVATPWNYAPGVDGMERQSREDLYF
jgi:hypothetical protein